MKDSDLCILCHENEGWIYQMDMYNDQQKYLDYYETDHIQEEIDKHEREKQDRRQGDEYEG